MLDSVQNTPLWNEWKLQARHSLPFVSLFKAGIKFSKILADCK